MDNGTLRLLDLQRDGWSLSFVVLNKVFLKVYGFYDLLF